MTWAQKLHDIKYEYGYGVVLTTHYINDILWVIGL